MPIQVLLADDHQIVRQSLKVLLEKEGLKIVGEASNGQEAVKIAESLHPDVAVLDVSMAVLNGIDAAKEIQKVSPQTKIIFLTVHDEGPYLLDALRGGAKGYVVKTHAAEKLVKAIREASRGGVYLSPEVSLAVVQAYQNKKEPSSEPLSPRERQVLQLIAEGGVAQPSWSGNWNLQNTQGTWGPFISSITLADSFWAMPGGNESANGSAIEQISTNQTQGTAEQLPPSNAAPPCIFWGQQVPPPPILPPLCSNYNAIELSTIASPSQIFSTYIQTFLGLQAQSNPNDNVATVSQGTNITASGQNVTFTQLGAIGTALWLINENPFKVQSERFDTTNNAMSAVTLQGHPLAGWRYWRAYSVGIGEVVIETGAVDTSAPGPLNYAGYWTFRGLQKKLWQEYLEFILSDIVKPQHLDPNATEIINPAYPVYGIWNPASPSQSDILYQVCQASTCH